MSRNVEGGGDTQIMPLELELFTPEGIEDPAWIYAKLRAESSISWSRALGAWLVMGHTEVAQAFRHPLLSSVRTEASLARALQRVAPDHKNHILRITPRFMTMQDPPEHRHTRRWASAGFGAEAIARWRPMVERIAAELLDAVMDSGRMDAVKEFAEPLPARVMEEMFDVEPAERPLFRHCSEEIAAFFGAAPQAMGDAAPRANSALAELEAYILRRLAARRGTPGGDLFSIWQSGHEGIAAEDIVAQCVAVIVGGNVTTSDQIALGIHTFLSHPAELLRVRETPELLRQAVDELVRFEGSVPFMHRIVKDDVELGGQLLRRGDTVLLGLTPANHDPSTFDAAETFDAGRQAGPGLGYGTGRHTCLGIHLARLELEVGLGTLFHRTTALCLDEAHPSAHKFNLLTRGLSSLWIKFQAAAVPPPPGGAAAREVAPPLCAAAPEAAAALSPTKRLLYEHLMSTETASAPVRPRGEARLPVVALQPGGSRIPLFCVPPAGGSPLCYLELAEGLGPDQPVYGFQSQGLLDGRPPLTSVEEMAALYLGGLREVQPAGPYVLGGWSVGATIAFEMARQLGGLGEQIALLVLIDGGVTEGVRTLDHRNPRHLVQWLSGMKKFVAGIETPATYEEIRRIGRWVGISLPPSLGGNRKPGVAAQWAHVKRLAADIAGSAKLFKVNTEAGQAYTPRPFAGKVALFRTNTGLPSDEDPLLRGVRRFCTGMIDVYDIPGNHLSVMLDVANVRALAERLAPCLQRISP